MFSQSRLSPAEEVIERILELSAEAQIKRRQIREDSPTFHNLTGAIRAYGKALDLLADDQVLFGQYDPTSCAGTPTRII